METRLKIVAVAIMWNGCRYWLPKPCRHHNLIWWLYNDYDTPISGDSIQGFMTNTNTFVTRITALHIAFHAGQISKETFDKQKKIGLFSEDLW